MTGETAIGNEETTEMINNFEDLNQKSVGAVIEQFISNSRYYG
jgi:hypothetical protein